MQGFETACLERLGLREDLADRETPIAIELQHIDGPSSLFLNANDHDCKDSSLLSLHAR